MICEHEQPRVLFIGVDPGLSGAMAALDASGGLFAIEDLPVMRDGRLAWIDAASLLPRVLEMKGDGHATAIVERQQAMPRQGVSSSFTIGVTFGSLLATLQTAGCAIELVTAGTWKRALGLLKTDKRASLNRALASFPHSVARPTEGPRPRRGVVARMVEAQPGLGEGGFLNDIESRVARRASALGFAIGSQQVGIRHTFDGGRTQRTLYDPENPSAVFATARDAWGLLPILWRVPSILGRRPRPQPDELVREVAAARGYRVLVQPSHANEQIAFLDAADRRVAGSPFWMEALRVVVGLPSIAPTPQAAEGRSLPRTDAPRPHAKDTSVDADNARRAELEKMDAEERADVEREERLKGPCGFCGGVGCYQCDPPKAA